LTFNLGNNETFLDLGSCPEVKDEEFKVIAHPGLDSCHATQGVKNEAVTYHTTFVKNWDY
jgi:hypothetical protein